MKEKETPLIKQYNRIKTKYPDTVLLFRLGDFFETFNDDARITSQVCGITLTKRNNGAAGDVPLAGFPHHQIDNYLPKLVRAGYRVAVCEQLEDPKKAKGIVKRDVIEVVTPGAAMYDKLLETKKNNYLAALYIFNIDKNEYAGLACTDISTGEFFVSQFGLSKIQSIIDNFNPAEIILSKTQKEKLLPYIEKTANQPHVTKLESWIFDYEFAYEAIKSHFKTKSLKGFGIDDLQGSVTAAGAIFYYLKETQQGELNQIQGISLYNPMNYMELDYATRRNLEITFSIQSSTKDGSLISILDKTKTPMGGRLFKKWISRPLINIEEIKFRLDAVTDIIDGKINTKFNEELQHIGDLERIISKICSGKSNPRDIIALKNSILVIPQLQDISKSNENVNLIKITNSFEPLADLVDLINNNFLEEPGQPGSGNTFRRGVNQELDSYIDAKYSGKMWIKDYQEKERERTGISTLKVGYNNIFGYYIEISHTHKAKIPDNYDRKQTLTNAERYITPELKEFETRILNAEEKITEIENEIYNALTARIALQTAAIQKNADLIAQIDCLNSYANSALEYNYTKPVIDESDIIEIEQGRHPVVERLLPIGERFQTNDTKLSNDGETIHIITGPNMAGKSCYLRQVGLIIYMGQIGSYVPAAKAHFGIIDRIFTRVGAQDNITAGESTFLIEMQEAANIMNNATERSLILLDEVGRGTATFDGISIAWSITEYIHEILSAKTLFATHYHELNELANDYEHIANYKIDVIETEGKLIFTHKVSGGSSDHSFGIHVAQMAGLPYDVISRANELMSNLEKSSTSDIQLKAETSSEKSTTAKDKPKSKRIPEQLAIFEIRDDNIREKIKNIHIDNVTPLQALQILTDMHNQIRRDSRN